MILDLAPYMRPKERLDLEDGLQILEDAQIALNAIGKKLAMMQWLAARAADPACDPVRRIDLNLRFKQLREEIDDWARCSSGGIQLLSGQALPSQQNFPALK